MLWKNKFTTVQEKLHTLLFRWGIGIEFKVLNSSLNIEYATIIP